MIKILAYFTLTLFVMVIPVAVCLLHAKNPQWFTKWKKLLWLLVAMLFSYAFVNAIIFIPYSLGLTQIRGPEAAFAVILGWLYLPIAAIPVMLIYFVLLAIRSKVSKRTIWSVLILCVLIFATIATGHIYHHRPLYRSNAAEVYELRGEEKIYGAVYRRLGFPDEYWLRMNDGWFVWSLDRDFIGLPNWPYYAPYLYFNHDMALGVDIDFPAKTDGKYLYKNDKSISWTIHSRTYHATIK